MSLKNDLLIGEGRSWEHEKAVANHLRYSAYRKHLRDNSTSTNGSGLRPLLKKHPCPLF